MDYRVRLCGSFVTGYGREFMLDAITAYADSSW